MRNSGREFRQYWYRSKLWSCRVIMIAHSCSKALVLAEVTFPVYCTSIIILVSNVQHTVSSIMILGYSANWHISANQQVNAKVVTLLSNFIEILFHAWYLNITLERCTVCDFFSEQHHNLHIICIFKRKPVKI